MAISFVTHRFTKRRLAASSADNIREKLVLSGIIGRKNGKTFWQEKVVNILNLTKILYFQTIILTKIVALCNVHSIIALSHETIVQHIGRGSVKSIVWCYIHCRTWQLKAVSQSTRTAVEKEQDMSLNEKSKFQDNKCHLCNVLITGICTYKYFRFNHMALPFCQSQIIQCYTIHSSDSRSVVSNSLRHHGLQAARLLSMEFSRQEYWSELPFPSPGDLPNPGMEHRSPALQADSLPSKPPGKPTDKTFLSMETGQPKKYQQIHA